MSDAGAPTALATRRPATLLPPTVLLAGALAGGIQPLGVLLGALFAIWVLHPPRQLTAGSWLVATLLAGAALAAHLVPGFAPLALGAARPFSADATPYALRLHWDKLLLGAVLLAWWLHQPRAPASRTGQAWGCALLTLLAVPALALALGVVAWQPKWPPELALWLALNLGVTALAEELLFRGLLQGALVERLGAARGIAVGAALFGLAHLPFSTGFAIAAALAGLGYGWVLRLSGRLWAAVLLHGTVNLVHFLLLSYPLRSL
ncbi:CPBP family intramembrane metalloprotease [Pseudomonas stutzeri]|nr:CPBP family intramembrane metalloprotease [Stutzerimonas stutzeri]